MRTVNMLEAKSNLSALVVAIENGTEREIVLARAGRPVARLVPIERSPVAQRIGVAKGAFTVPEPNADFDKEISDLFLTGGWDALP